MVAIDRDRHPACLVATGGYNICDSCSPAIRSLVATKTQAGIILTTVKIRISEEPEPLSMPSEAQQSKLQQPWKTRDSIIIYHSVRIIELTIHNFII
jgi:hypothetical protein